MKKFMKEMMHSYCVLVLAALYKRVILYWLGFPIYSRSIEKNIAIPCGTHLHRDILYAVGFIYGQMG